MNERTAGDILSDAGYDDVVIFSGDSYDTALIGVTHDDRAVYDYDLMVRWLMERDGMTELDAMEWIDYNAIRSLPYYEGSPVIMYRLEEIDEQICGVNEQIKWERDVAIEQLNELGYGFGEKIQEASYKTKYQQLLQDVHDYQGSICCYCKNYNRNNCEHFGDLPHEDGIPLSCGKFMWRREERT